MTVSACLFANLWCTVALLLLQLIQFVGGILLYLVGGMFTMLLTFGTFDFREFFPLVVLGLLGAIIVESLPLALIEFLAMRRARKESLMNKTTMILLSLLLLIPVMNLIPVIRAFCIVRREEKMRS